MERVGIYEAKAKLSDLVERVSRGGEVTITRHGAAVAKLVPARARRAGSERAEVIREILEFGKTVKAKRFNLRKAIEQGRK